MNIENFKDYLLGKGFSRSTSSGYARDVLHFIHWCEKENMHIETVVYADILYYLQSFKEKVQQRTASGYMNSLKHYFKYLKVNGYILENPVSQVQVKGIKRKKLYHVLTKPELESLYHHFEIPPEESEHKNQNWYRSSILTAKRNKAILGLMVYQGLTTNELANLNEKDIKLREGTIYITGTRRSNERTLKLEAFQVMGLMEYVLQARPELIQTTGKETEKLFISNGKGNSLQNAIQNLTEKLKRQNKKVANAKQIRASVITHWLKLYNLRQVQYIAGHRFISSTESYLINDIEDLQEDINKYHPIG